MIHYRDRTYCAAKCRTTACSRNVTPEVFEAACRWSRDRDPTFSLSPLHTNCPDYVPAEEPVSCPA